MLKRLTRKVPILDPYGPARDLRSRREGSSGRRVSRRWRSWAQARDVLRKIDAAQLKEGSLEIRDLRISAVKEVAEDWHLCHQTVHRNLKQCFYPHLRNIHAFDDLVRKALPILRRLRESDPGADEPEIHTLRCVWEKTRKVTPASWLLKSYLPYSVPLSCSNWASSSPLSNPSGVRYSRNEPQRS